MGIFTGPCRMCKAAPECQRYRGAHFFEGETPVTECYPSQRLLYRLKSRSRSYFITRSPDVVPQALTVVKLGKWQMMVKKMVSLLDNVSNCFWLVSSVRRVFSWVVCQTSTCWPATSPTKLPYKDCKLCEGCRNSCFLFI